MPDPNAAARGATDDILTLIFLLFDEDLVVFRVFTSVFVVLLIAESEELTKVAFLAA